MISNVFNDMEVHKIDIDDLCSEFAREFHRRSELNEKRSAIYLSSAEKLGGKFHRSKNTKKAAADRLAINQELLACTKRCLDIATQIFEWLKINNPHNRDVFYFWMIQKMELEAAVNMEINDAQFLQLQTKELSIRTGIATERFLTLQEIKKILGEIIVDIYPSKEEAEETLLN